ALEPPFSSCTMRKSIQLRASCQFGAQRIYSPAFARLTNNDGLTPNALAIERSDSPFAWRLRTTSMSMSARFGPGTLPALRARSRPAFVRSEMLMRSCSARVAIIEIITSRIIPHARQAIQLPEQQNVKPALTRCEHQTARCLPMLPTWQELFMELLLDPDRSQIRERVQIVIHAIVRRYREPEPLTAKERSAIDLALDTMARWTL